MSQVSYGTITITDTNDIERIYTVYAKSANNTTVPSIAKESWSENVSTAPGTGNYIWQRTVVEKSGTGDKTYSDPVCLTGEEGTDATEISGIEVRYGISADWNTQPTSWSADTPAYDSSKPKYWTRTRLVYDTNPVTYSDSVYTKDEALTKAVADAAIANSIAQHANEDAQGAMSQSASNISEVKRIWFLKNTSGAPDKPTSSTTIYNDNAANHWTTVHPTVTGYRYYYYCEQTTTGGGIKSWSDVYLDLSEFSEYEIGAMKTRFQSFFYPGDSNYPGAYAVGKSTSDGLDIEDISTYGYNLRLTPTALSIGYNAIKAIEIDGATPALKFYKPSKTSQGAQTAQLDAKGLVLSEGGIESGSVTSGNGYIYLSTADKGSVVNTLVPTPSGGTPKTDWRAVIGSKFGVDSEGNLYANNARISGAVEATEGFVVKDTINNNQVTLASLTSSGITIGQTTGSIFNVKITDSADGNYGPGILLRRGSVVLNEVLQNGMKIYDGTTNNNCIANFGEVIKLGAYEVENKPYITMASSSIDFKTGNVSYLSIVSDSEDNIIGRTVVSFDETYEGAFGGPSRISSFTITFNELDDYDNGDVIYLNGASKYHHPNIAPPKVASVSFSIHITKGTPITSSSPYIDANIPYAQFTYDGNKTITGTPTEQDETNWFSVYMTEMEVPNEFNNGKIRIGLVGTSYLEVSSNSLLMKDSQQNEYFKIKDAADETGRVVETFTGTGATNETFNLKYEAQDTTYQVTKNGEVVTITSTNKQTTYFKLTTQAGDTIVVTYIVANNTAKGYDFGIRKANSITGAYSVIEGNGSAATGACSHAENTSTASGDYSHAEGYGTASGDGSHAENRGTATGNYSHAEGYQTTASGPNSHAEGDSTIASKRFSHAEGWYTTASGIGSHAEGYRTTASEYYSHAEGTRTIASGQNSHAQNTNTIAQRKSQTALGAYNEADTGGTDESTRGNYVVIVGNGTADNARSNALTVDWGGNLITQGMAGMIQMFAGSTLPTNSGWLLCNGAEYLKTDYPTLYSVIGDTFGTHNPPSDSDHFRVPDLRGRVPIGSGHGDATGHTAHSLGDRGGNENAIVPYHRHGPASGTYMATGSASFSVASNKATSTTGSGISNLVRQTGTISNPQYTDYAGTSGNTTGANMMPYLTINYIICTGKTS